MQKKMKQLSMPVKLFGLLFGLFLMVMLGAYAILPPSIASYEIDSEAQASAAPAPEPELVEEVTHIAPPAAVKAIYMTSHVGGYLNEAGEHSWRNNLIKMIDETELNSLVIDIKDYSGKISFDLDDELVDEIGAEVDRIPDIKEFIRELHEHDIYVIGRVSVMQDPHLAGLRPDLAVKRADGSVWTDGKGLSWIDPAARESWYYHAAIARASYAIGFDEINFDYVRFPSDGNMKDISYDHYDDSLRPKHEQMALFYEYLGNTLRPEGVVISADLFGMTTSAVEGFDLNIGQILEDALPHFDYIAPMVYPSHYPPGFNGWADPNEVPYELIYHVMSEGVEKAVAMGEDPLKLRPWLQDFDYGGDYDAADVRAQIKGTYDAGLTSWMLWDPGVTYTREALLAD